VLLVFDRPVALDRTARAHVADLGEQAVEALARAVAFEREHDVAVRLQRSLLPAQLPTIDGLDLAGRYRAGTGALEVGGDWYDVVRRPDGIVHLVVGDVAGRGVNAAILMGRLTTAFRAYAFDDGTAGDVLRHLLRHVAADDMATAVCVTLDPYTNLAHYASAGHLSPLLVDDDAGTVTHLDRALAPPLGFVAADAVREERLVLPPRATLVAYTDGLVERRDVPVDAGIARVTSIVTEGGATTADALATAVLDGALGDATARDDVALLVVRLLGTPAVLDVEVPATPASLAPLRHRLRGWLTLRGVGEARAADTVLAVSEACNNAIEHAYATRAGTVRVVAEHRGASLRIVVEDAGGWRETAPDPERGRGIPIMHGVMDRVEIERQPAATRVTLEQRLDD
jgi:serine phosphatase RsbU (regulator of sigma subunit)/anti-sigma regulatory factor (Ser/Thr protein kinase)